ncbi:interleukin 2 receptor, gamma a isoform X2 [Danio aesculapii]|uniref:interleukin 2 receptor, gamma a isoform X2 n=1 Tax=Danio aesculapii TaxID=1142201 RepID=UPI0024C0B211|nr:interleukin 2 receptor, gamma a isoform X2 [Danio aesculapii]
MKLLFLTLFFANFCTFSASSDPKINCLIINLDYVNCTWSEHQYNYSLKGGFSHDDIVHCPKYETANGVNVACMLPYKRVQRFNKFTTSLYRDDGSLVTEQEHDLKAYVKLNPPTNLSVVEKKDAELWLYWNVTENGACTESEVRYRTDQNNWKDTTPGTRTTYSLPFPSNKQYEFQVRARIPSSCGQSKFWSEWSESVTRGTVKTNDTESLGSMSVTSLVLYAVGATILLVILSCLLVHSERLRIILIPVVPNAGRNVSNYLAALFDNYDGNVEKWLSMPKDLENGFKPNFTERACPVREYRIMSQSTSDSESILSNPTDVSSDYQSMHRYSSSSTIPGSAEPLQTQNTSQDNPV